MTTISRDVAAHTLYHFRGEGYPPGSFTEALLVAFSRADSSNRALLGLGFPDYHNAISLAQDHPEGIDLLRTILKGE